VTRTRSWHFDEISMFFVMRDLLAILLLIAFYDLQTYILHYASHHTHPWLKKMHAIHHEYNMPNSIIAGLYGDSFELFLITSFALWPPCVFKVSIPAMCIYLWITAFFAQMNHSGKKVVIPFIYTYKYHYNHHKFRNCNYCEHLMLWDYLFGTLNLS